MASQNGHRSDYQKVLSLSFKLAPSIGKVSRKDIFKLVRARTVLFGSLDDDVRGFLLIALLRFLVLKKTVGLFLRPQSCFERKKLSSWLKCLIFYLISRCPKISVISIVPFRIEPKFHKVANQSVTDPQMWDRTILPPAPCSNFRQQIRAFAGKRRLLAFIGVASASKGLLELLDIMALPHFDRSICVVFVGPVPKETADLLAQAENLGAMVVGRFVSNAELDSVYQEADLIWSAYRPGYDQASGNFGRAIQSGKIPVVRRGALIERQARQMGYPVVAIDFDYLAQGAESLRSLPPLGDPGLTNAIQTWRLEFIDVLKRSL